MIKRIKEMYSKSKFSKNTAPKVLSLVFAIVFWIFVIDNVNPEITRVIENIPVELIGVSQLEADGYRIMGDRDFTVDITIKGRRNDLIKMNKSDIDVTADLGSLKNGLQEIPLKSQIGLNDVIMMNRSRENILLQIDAIIRKPIVVVIDKEGQLPESYVDESTRLSLEEIFVSGPETYVNMVDRMYGQINLNNVTEEIDRDLAVVPVDINGETVTGIDVETNYVSVKIEILKRSEVIIEPKYQGSVAEGYQLTKVIVIPEVINLRGDRDDINTLKYIESEMVDLTGADETFSIEIPLNVPNGMILDNLEQRVYISFEIEEIITKEFAFDYSDITFINMNDSFRTNIAMLEGQVFLRISAVESLIDSITKSDLGLFIDGENFETGAESVKILLNRSNEFNNVEILPERIEIIISDVNDPIEDENTGTNEDQ